MPARTGNWRRAAEGSDCGWVALIVLAGGKGGPLPLTVGLATASAASAALLLNLEGLTTMAIPRESLARMSTGALR
jgi:hypothetical protein